MTRKLKYMGIILAAMVILTLLVVVPVMIICPFMEFDQSTTNTVIIATVAVMSVFTIITEIVIFFSQIGGDKSEIFQNNGPIASSAEANKQGICPMCGAYIGFSMPDKCPVCNADLVGKL